METNDLVQKTLSDLTKTEKIILACCDHYVDVIRSAAPMVCMKQGTDEWTRMFSSGPANALYRVLNAWYCIRTRTKATYTKVPYSMVETLLKQLCSSGESIGVSIHNAHQVIDLLKEIREDKLYEGWDSMSKELMTQWVHLMRIESVNDVFASAGAGTWSPQDYADQVAAAGHGLTEDNEEDEFYSGAEMVSDEDKSVRIPTGLPRLDAFLKGGFVMGTTALLHAPSGGGKTIAASQLYTAMAKQNAGNFNGLYISTEQHPKELIGRIVSSELSIPFDLTMDGVVLNPKTTPLSPRQREQAEEMLNSKFGKSLHMVRWTNKGNLPFKERMMEIIGNFRRKFGDLHFIFFDWLGDALVTDLRASSGGLNPAKIYEHAAGDLKDIAKDEGPFTMFFAQSHDAQCAGKKYNKFSYLQDCKNLHNYVELGGGISALALDDQSKKKPKHVKRSQKKEEEDPTKVIYQAEQYWYFQKVRKGVARPFKVFRDFAYQRWLGLDELTDPDVNKPSALANIQNKRTT